MTRRYTPGEIYGEDEAFARNNTQFPVQVDGSGRLLDPGQIGIVDCSTQHVVDAVAAGKLELNPVTTGQPDRPPGRPPIR